VFTVGALALAGPRANAVGAVRLDLAPEGMAIELLRVAAFAEGFAPGAVAEPVRLFAPYTAVRGLVRQGGLLYLTLDPAALAPYNRFALAGFSEDPAETLVRAFRARTRLRWAADLLPVPLGALAALLVPDTLATGVLGRASLGALAALSLFALFRELWAWQTWGGPIAERLRDRFEAELGERLALVARPVVVRVPSPALAARVPRRRWLTRTTSPEAIEARGEARPAATAAPPPEDKRPMAAARPVAILVGIAAAIVGVMAFVGHFAAPRAAAPPAVDRLERGLGAAARSLVPGRPPTTEPDRCTCMHADSPLWKNGIPRLAVLTFHGEEELAGPLVPQVDREGASKYEFDIAVVNDGARPIHNPTLTLVFARRRPNGRRVATDRGLFWEGDLAPGAAIKWRVKAPGTEMRIDVSVTGTLEEAGMAPAPPDAFQHLLASSHFRAVRAHAALMLAYLRDPRAEAAARDVQGAGDPSFTPALLRASAPVFACDVRRASGRLDACIFNATSRIAKGLVLRQVTLGAPAQSFPVETEVPVHEGRHVSAPIPEDVGELEVTEGAGPD
jgi:hypothetical protein